MIRSGGFAALALAALASGCADEPAQADPELGARPAPVTPASAPAAQATPDLVAVASAPVAPVAPPTYPLKEWMGANLARPIKSADYDALERALNEAAGFAPDEFDGWRTIARSGASAARAHDLDRVRASCGDCHNKYRAEYRDKMRSRPLPEMRRTR